jgi:hypothetical protein
MKGKNSDEFATGWSFIRNRRMDLGLTSGIESTATVVVALFMVAGKKIKMAAARGSSVDEVLPVRGRTVARSHFWFCLRMRSGETGYHRELEVVAMVAGKELDLGGGGKGDGREPSAKGRGRSYARRARGGARGRDAGARQKRCEGYLSSYLAGGYLSSYLVVGASLQKSKLQ